MMKVALVVDWLDKYAGSERVMSSITKVFTISKSYTLINIMKQNDIEKTFSNQKVSITESYIKLFKNKFRAFFFLFPNAIQTLTIDKEIKLILSSSHSVAKGIKKTNKNQIHFCYVQARNQKYIWEDSFLYFKQVKYLIYPLLKWMQENDLKQSKNPDYFIANSYFVKDWILKKYNRDSKVIYPPVDVDKFDLVTKKQDYFIVVGRIEKYKRFDIIVKAFNSNGKQLIVIGNGSQYHTLKKIAKKNITFLGYLDTAEINTYLGSAKAFIHTGIEDFGISPVEAQACGTPVIAYNSGGLKETVIENKTGVFFNKQEEQSLISAIEDFEKRTFSPQEIRKNAERFSRSRFEKELKEYIDKKINEL